ncbi:hypothetical protein [Clostridium grantii]|uniref:Uncharacterized protein n=1 Tax=Clostridium grantii DSM 8605 TaxID=1121316 RepID=A0A1M5SDN4_9CLOT|nr:hypothetical protein [Clostridium grantii]SHH36626.1 hypothetical protein SAMN02745207_00883 [Clostridium grantii DSM 8605]
MNTNNLQINQGYKYKELCSLLEVEEKSRGNSRNCQYKDFERYFTYHKVGQKTFIDEIFAEVKEKIDNRKGHSGKSEGSRNQTTLYANYIDAILTNYFYSIQENHKIDNTIYRTNLQMLQIANLINENYKRLQTKEEEIVKYISKNGLSFISFNNVMFQVSSIANRKIEQSLTRLQNKNIIKFQKGYIISYFDEERISKERIANTEETQIIKDIEKKLLDAYDTTIQQLKFDKKALRKFYDKVKEEVKKEIECMYFYVGYEITAYYQENREIIDEEYNNAKKLKQIIKSKVAEKAKLQVEEIIVRKKQLDNDILYLFLEEEEDKVFKGSKKKPQYLKSWEMSIVNNENYLNEVKEIVNYIV